MRATWYEKNGEARDVLVTREMPLPVPAAGEVRVLAAHEAVEGGKMMGNVVVEVS